MAAGLGLRASSGQLMIAGEQVMMAVGLLVRKSAGQATMTGELRVRGPYPVMMSGETQAQGFVGQVMMTAELRSRDLLTDKRC